MQSSLKRTVGAVTAFIMGNSAYKYDSIPVEDVDAPGSSKALKTKRKLRVIMITTLVGVALLAYLSITSASPIRDRSSCDDIYTGYQCQDDISHFWGQYSPYFTVPSGIIEDVPPLCQINFIQILSRHGARDPTASKTAAYNATIQQIQNNVNSYSGDYAFLADYEYTLGADQLTTFGQQQMVNSGVKYYQRYEGLTRNTDPFVRSSGEARVVESAQNWTQGFHNARLADRNSHIPDDYPYNMVVISEDTGSNNTLNHGLCTDFENGYDSTIADSAQSIWANIFAPPITQRLNTNLPGANLTQTQTIYMMDLCPFNTVASITGQISPFCDLFTDEEWRSYDYYESLGKYYGYSWGNPLGATQGVGFTNELIARLADSAVHDHTSTNSTLDNSSLTFPVGGKTTLYADFSHDNDMTAIFSALGLYNSTASLANTTVESVQETNGYSASWTVPFAARAYFEKMTCAGSSEEYVRVLVNDRVLPLETCGGDPLGRCTLSSFVNSLSFAQEGGHWDQCFV